MELSKDPEAKYLSLGENNTVLTSKVWPVRI